MKTKTYKIDGSEGKEITLPKCFSSPLREDLVSKILEAKKVQQPYSPSPVAGKQASASGKLIHRRHVWKSQYGRGMSRIPRKTMTRKGSQFNWVGATVPSTVGGRRAHPPKVASMINTLKINKKEMKIALCSALTATTKEALVEKRYASLNGGELRQLPLILETKGEIKVKTLVAGLKKILGDAFDVSMKNKTIRAGKGKMRGRKYKSNAGLLIVAGIKEKIKTKRFDIVRSDKLSVNDLAKGGQGRLTLYTETAVTELGEKLK
jgi:large subunit ribosomal protein L4e